ncbi:MAG: hypothetical protein JWM28_3191 [Chitinophagaceae bacterium]|nr:hypothetical protein [Chitinophagaceae bacterium]
MKIQKPLPLSFLLLVSTQLFSQNFDFEKSILRPVHVSMSLIKMEGKKAVRVTKDSSIKEFDEPTFVKLENIDFKNGVIEVTVLSKLLPAAPDFARGFIGVAFRINEDNSRFESIYIRPTNGRANEQLRRNRSVQYFSYPDYRFERLRKDAAGEYESYADMGLNEWIKIKIVVKDAQAKLFLNNNQHPSLVVNDLKHGSNNKGAIGLFVDIGTEGFFSDLKITKEN